MQLCKKYHRPLYFHDMVKHKLDMGKGKRDKHERQRLKDLCTSYPGETWFVTWYVWRNILCLEKHPISLHVRMMPHVLMVLMPKRCRKRIDDIQMNKTNESNRHGGGQHRCASACTRASSFGAHSLHRTQGNYFLILSFCGSGKGACRHASSDEASTVEASTRASLRSCVHAHLSVVLCLFHLVPWNMTRQ